MRNKEVKITGAETINYMRTIDPDSWRKVGEYIRQATVEVAQSSGGQEITQDTIRRAGNSSQLLPDPKAIEYLNEQFPGAAKAIVSRAEQIQKARLKRERRSLLSKVFRRS